LRRLIRDRTLLMDVDSFLVVKLIRNVCFLDNY